VTQTLAAFGEQKLHTWIGQEKDITIPKSQWHILVDNFTNYKFSHFYEKKNLMVEQTCELIKELRSKGLMLSYLRLENAGENKLLEARCKSSDWQFIITFEYTARDSPQHNHMAELDLQL